MYSGGGSFPSPHKCSTRSLLFALLALKAHCQGALYPWGSISTQAQTPRSCLSCAVGIPWHRPVPCCPSSLTGSPGWSPDPSVAPEQIPWMDSGPNSSPHLGWSRQWDLATRTQLCPSSSDAAGLCPGWGGHCLRWGHRQRTACPPHGAAPLLRLPDTNNHCNMTGTFSSVLPGIKEAAS